MEGPNDVRPCRISGLTSAKGLELNGSAARAPFDPDDARDGRVPVLIDGNPGGPLSLKRSNLTFVPATAYQGGIGVGRGTIRDKTFFATASTEDAGRSPRVVLREPIKGGSARSRGNLIAATAHFKTNKGRKTLQVTCTDLNVARALNRVANGGDARLSDRCQELFLTASSFLRKETEKETDILVIYEPHRLSYDSFSRDEQYGKSRHGAVITGAFKIYPCSHKDYWDAMEVRFVDGVSDPNQKIIHHEVYLDYGHEEAVTYALNALALGERECLSPLSLAQVDPQAFWSAVLHIEHFLAALKKEKKDDLIKEWNQMLHGAKKSNILWRVHAQSAVDLPDSVISGEHMNDDWSIKTDEEHEKMTTSCAMVAIPMMVDAAGRADRLKREEKSEYEDGDLKPLRINTLDDFKGTDVDRMTQAFTAASEREKKRLASGKKLKQEHRDRFLNEALKEAGFGSDALDLNSDPLVHCAYCKKVFKRSNQGKMCAKCKGAAYCDDKCQNAHWKTHKKECSPILAHGRRLMRDTERKTGENVKCGMYKPRSSLPTQPSKFVETTFVGAVCVMWLPGTVSSIGFVDTATIREESTDIWKIESAVLSEAIPPFETLPFIGVHTLPAPMRFLLACGPLCDINIARSSLDETIGQVRDITKLRMKCAGFTALEWAAKKGNTETVEWLCTDERSKALINIGCPVGWACYTGRVDVARTLVSYGADAAKTDEFLWGSTPPLLVAAQNGKLESMKYLVDELGHDIHMVDPYGRNILKSIKCAHEWRSLEGRNAIYKWAKRKMG